MKLYYAPGACSLADHIALCETELPFDTEQVDLRQKRTASGEDFVAINPKGYVPALQLDDGEVLTENIAILSYIADRGDLLEPRNTTGHWRVLEALAYISTEIHKSFKPFFMPGATDADKANAREFLLKRLGYLDEKLEGHEFLVGDTFSVADCYLFVMLYWARAKAELTLPQRLSAYVEALAERPSVVKAMTAEGLR
ncbi:Glutathione S-transferase domain-containing protein [Novosphingobium sp. Rr 2-17]|uniref:glutathione transferase GstA n=1 Tax=Novosphingobium sp. Rr 2-17 TaxID=555793 RepID=UPI0002698841|nr:glutathione transferase GstA [Novosphingobium sp. Rr 2-17]EIZ80555.1 Glutathione S-transferase domain-containing protein [Novosphingobium sp. Rr 2-17]